MKKRLTFIIALLGIAITLFAAPSVKEVQKATSETAKAVSTIHKDVKDITSTLHEDVKEVVSTTHEDAKSITSTLYGDGKEAVKELYPGIKKTVIEIGKAIGVAAEHVYTVLVKKYVVEGIVQLLPFLLGIILVIIAWIKIGKYFRISTKVDWHVLYPTVLLLSGIIALCCVDYNTMIMGLVNPEYGAINYILEYSKQMLQ